MAHYKRGDLVWAKMKGFPPWPGIITAPPPELKKQPSKKSTLYHCIFFFGTKNYSWIETHKLERYKKGSQPSGKRSVALREACTAIEAYVETGEGSSNFNITPEDDAFDKLVNEGKKTPIQPKQKSRKLEDETTEEEASLSDDYSSGGDAVTEYESMQGRNENEATTERKRNVGEKDGIDQPSKSIPTISTPANKESPNKDSTSDSSRTLSPPLSAIQRDLSRTLTNISETPTNQPSQDTISTSSQEKLPTPAPTNLNSSPMEQEELVSFLSSPSSVEEDPLRVDSCHDDIEEMGSSSAKNLPEKPDNKQPCKPSTRTPRYKKKKIQQVVKAHPFRPIIKPRVVERRPSINDNELRGTTSGSSSTTGNNNSSSSTGNNSNSTSESTSKKRSYSSNHDGGTESARRKKRQLYSVADTTTPVVHSPYSRRGPASLLFERPPNITRPETPPLDLFTVSQTLIDKHITPSPLRFGFLGLGIMGSSMVKNLLNSGHRVIVWNRSPEKSREFAKVGAEMAVTPQDVCAAADITFSCVSGPKAAKDMVFGNCGALREMNSSKAYVEMTNIDKETSISIAEAITSRGARYLEAQIQGSKAEADEGSLVILTAGDRSLYNECHSCFEAFGRSSFFLGEVGNATKMNLVIQIIAGITLAGLAEGLALADRSGLQQSDVLEVIGMTSLRSQMITEKGKCIAKCTFPTSLALTHMQKDLKLGLKLGDALEHPLPLTAMTNEMFKHSKRLGYGDHDVSAVYIRARF